MSWGEQADHGCAVDVRIEPFSPFGKNPPAVTDALVRYTMLSTAPVVRL